jgi:hypothetical protein
MLRHPLKKSYNRPAQNTKHDKWVTRDLRLISGTVSVADLLQDRLENLRINQATVLGLLHLMEVLQVYSTVVVSITELIIMDVIAGHVVFPDRNKVYVLRRLQTCITRNYIGKGIKENMKNPLVDFKVTNYRMPIILLTR